MPKDAKRGVLRYSVVGGGWVVWVSDWLTSKVSEREETNDWLSSYLEVDEEERKVWACIWTSARTKYEGLVPFRLGGGGIGSYAGDRSRDGKPRLTTSQQQPSSSSVSTPQQEKHD